MTTNAAPPSLSDSAVLVETVRSRIRCKMKDYAAYDFTAPESCAR